jgi:hypothetical protein
VSAPGGPHGRPLLTLDFDGVICGPPLRVNLGIHRRFLDPRGAPPAARVPPRWLSLLLDRPRFAFRRPLPGVREALARLARERRLIVLTGRRTSPERWLARHGLAGFVEAVRINEDRLASAHYKLAAILELGAAEHIDDDPRTVQLLAERAASRIFLRDWPRNRDLPYAPSVTRVADLGALARLLVPDDKHEPARDAPAPAP